MTANHLEALARSIDSAWSHAGTVPAPSSLHPTLTAEDAYAVQDLIIAGRVAGGRQIAGWKLGLTSAPPPAIPIAGTLLDDMVIASGTLLRRSTMVGPMVEAEIVFQIGEDLNGPVSLDELAGSPHRVAGGIEVIDYRTIDSAGEVDWIADNSTVAYAVVGEWHPLEEVDPAEVSVSLRRGDDEIASGRGAVVMGDPRAAVVWLSEHLARRNRSLREGEIVLTGSLTGHHVVPDGDVGFTAYFSGLGQTSVIFAP